jgi:1,4-dihydroxy-2-naphthoate octaprenyltransferase
VRLGREATRRLYVVLLGGAYAILLATVLINGGPWWALLGFASAPLQLAPTRAVLTRSDGAALNKALAGTGALLAAFSVLVSGGLLIAS